MKRILLLLLAAILLLSLPSCSLFGGAGTTAPSPSGDPSGQSASSTLSPAPELSGSDSGTASAPSLPSILDLPEDARYTVPVMQVGDFQVTYGLYRYFYRLLADSMAGEDTDYFKKNPEKLEELAEKAREQCKIVAAYYGMAKKEGLTLPDEQTADKAFTEYVTTYEPMYPVYYGMTMAEYLEKNYTTLSTYKTMFVVSEYLTEQIYTFLSDEKNGKLDLSDEALDKALEDYRCVKHILVGHDDGLKDEEALALATDLAKRLREGADIDALMKEYSNDYQENGQNAYTFTYGEMVSEFEEAAFNMEVGQVTDPVKSTYGYHVIVRLEIDKEAFKKDKFKDIAVNEAFFGFAEKQSVTELAAFATECSHEKIMAD